MPRRQLLKIAPYSFLLLSIVIPIVTLPQRPSQATPLTPIAKPLPPWTTSVIEQMASRLGATPGQFTIAKITPATWQDCAVMPDRAISSDCQPVAQSGWRVNVNGKGETWQYLVTMAGKMTLDAPASMSPKARSAVATALNQETIALQAVELKRNMSGCPVGAMCKMSVNPVWQILVPGHSPVTVSLQGKVLPGGSLVSFLPAQLAGLPPSYGDAVLQDVRDRTDDEKLSQNLRTRIKAISWHECHGGNPAPTPPERGICPDITRTGWQMITTSGPTQWVHYLIKPTGTTLPPIGPVVPDGLQSLPAPIAKTLIYFTVGHGLTKQFDRSNQSSLSDYRIHAATATFFDACLNPVGVNSALSCRQGIQSGWIVSVRGIASSAGGDPLSTYHVDATGKNYRLISQTQWLPVPSAPPIGR